MYPISARLLAVFSESHTPVFRADLFRADGGVEQLEIVGGSVPVDGGQTIRRTCTVIIADLSLIPRTARDKLSTYGSQIRLSRGALFSDGPELVPLGVFRIDSVDGDVDTGPVTITGKSLECVISDDKFTTPWRATGTAVGAVTALIQRSIPTASVISTVVDAAIGPKTFDVQGDPWAAVVECAAAVGAEVYADADGVFIIRVLPDLLAVAPVWTVAAGEGGALISARRGMSAAGVYNGVLASGENTEANAPPVSSLMVDSDPSSPTYWGGAFGRRPTFHSSATLTTTAACTAAATVKLRAAVAPNAIADISSLPNPALEPGDVVRVVYSDGTKELHQIRGFTVPLEIGGDFALTTMSAKEDG